MRLTPQQILERFTNMCDAGDIQAVQLAVDDEFVGYLFSAHPVHAVFLRHSEDTEDQCAFTQGLLALLQERGGDVVLLQRGSFDPPQSSSADLGLLTAEERECWELRSFSIRTIAGKVGRSPGTVRRRLASARAKLQHIQAGP